MKKFDTLRMVLFDSTNAHFRLGVEGQFQRGNSQQGFHDLVYVTERGTGMLTSNVYLTLSYRGDETPTPVYTSYPQIYPLRKNMKMICDMIDDPSSPAYGFINVDGVTTVKNTCTDPIVLSGIGKKNNWVSFKLIVISSDGDNGVKTSNPGVSIRLSTSDNYESPLTADEFLSLYTIVMDLNLSMIQCSMSIAYLENDQVPQQNNVYNASTTAVGYAPANNNAPAPYYSSGNGNGYGNGYRGGYGNNNGYQQTPKYNSGSYHSGNNNSGYGHPRYFQPVAPAPAPTPAAPQPQKTNLPPRQEAASSNSILNPKSVEDTPASMTDISLDDEEAINNIFDTPNQEK